MFFSPLGRIGKQENLKYGKFCVTIVFWQFIFFFYWRVTFFFFFNVKALYMLCSSFAGIIMESFWDTHGENLVGFLVWPCKHYSLPESHCCSRWISNSSSNCHLIAPFSLLFQGLVVACFLMCLSLQISG